ncbi:hypothetical protein GIB67_030912 [Kingdonia uniflora]|uniref:Uncharacterized protein n=1 Tax=Kingdonia uniflora TaxID=39325 RepID=A0A7J7L3L1_9MAGN|nr:hypothetical protein GIB67_030912 [Kingdonia uniflora]
MLRNLLVKGSPDSHSRTMVEAEYRNVYALRGAPNDLYFATVMLAKTIKMMRANEVACLIYDFNKIRFSSWWNFLPGVANFGDLEGITAKYYLF